MGLSGHAKKQKYGTKCDNTLGFEVMVYHSGSQPGGIS